MRNVVVVDASIGVKWILKEADADIAENLLIEWNNKRTVVLAPALFAYEITNVLHKNVLKGEITLERAKKALEEILLIGLKLDFSSDLELSKRAVELANRFSLPATYDAHYLALAEREGCDLWTDDTRMWRAVKGQLDWVCCLNDYHPA